MVREGKDWIAFFYYGGADGDRYPCFAQVRKSAITTLWVYMDEDGRHICFNHGGGSYKITENGPNRFTFRWFLDFALRDAATRELWEEVACLWDQKTEPGLALSADG